MATHHLLLLRHAKSSWATADLADHDRPLSSRGRSAATAVVEHLTASGAIPDLVLCSSARRTVETLERIGECLRPDTAVDVDDRLYGAGCGTLLACARQFPEAVGTAMFIGHNPGIEDLAALLAGDGDPTSLDEMGAKFPTAAIAHLRIDLPWSELAAGGAFLEQFWTPR